MQMPCGESCCTQHDSIRGSAASVRSRPPLPRWQKSWPHFGGSTGRRDGSVYGPAAAGIHGAGAGTGGGATRTGGPVASSSSALVRASPPAVAPPFPSRNWWRSWHADALLSSHQSRTVPPRAWCVGGPRGAAAMSSGTETGFAGTRTVLSLRRRRGGLLSSTATPMRVLTPACAASMPRAASMHHPGVCPGGSRRGGGKRRGGRR